MSRVVSITENTSIQTFYLKIAGILLRNFKKFKYHKSTRTIIFLAKKLFRIRSWTKVCNMEVWDSESGKKGDPEYKGRKKERERDSLWLAYTE